MVGTVSLSPGGPLAAAGAFAAEPEHEAGTAWARAASEPRAAQDEPSEQANPAQSACSPGSCRLPTGTPDQARPLDSSPPLGERETAGVHPVQPAVNPRRLAAAGDRQLGLRILKPLYAIVALPSHAAWSPVANRPAAQRILVGLSFVVQF